MLSLWVSICRWLEFDILQMPTASHVQFASNTHHRNICQLYQNKVYMWLLEFVAALFSKLREKHLVCQINFPKEGEEFYCDVLWEISDRCTSNLFAHLCCSLSCRVGIIFIYTSPVNLYILLPMVYIVICIYVVPTSMPVVMHSSWYQRQ